MNGFVLSNTCKVGNGGFEVIEEKLPKTSAFKLIPNERLELSQKTYGGFLNSTDDDVMILKALNKLLVATSKMITEYLNNIGMKIESESVAKSLKKLSHYRAVAKYRFVTDTGRSSYVVYRIWNVGAGILSSNGERWRLKGYLDVAIGDTVQIKRLLSANQVMINMLMDDGYEPLTGQSITIKKENIINSPKFRAHGMAVKKDKIIVVESVRRDDGYMNYLKEKLRRIDDTLKHDTNYDITGKAIKVIICAEDKDQMSEIISEIDGYSPKRYKISFTYDLGALAKEEILKQENKNFFHRLFAI